MSVLGRSKEPSKPRSSIGPSNRRLGTPGPTPSEGAREGDDDITLAMCLPCPLADPLSRRSLQVPRERAGRGSKSIDSHPCPPSAAAGQVPVPLPLHHHTYHARPHEPGNATTRIDRPFHVRLTELFPCPIRLRRVVPVPAPSTSATARVKKGSQRRGTRRRHPARCSVRLIHLRAGIEKCASGREAR